VTNELHAGMVGEAHGSVTEQNTAIALGSGDVPVFATPALLALMEEAAINAIQGALEEGTTSVGVSADLRHLAATAIGGAVRAQARLTLVEGRRLAFRILAYDGKQQIGEATHERRIVDRARFLERTGVTAGDR
jgi:predicted thioesterase